MPPNNSVLLVCKEVTPSGFPRPNVPFAEHPKSRQKRDKRETAMDDAPLPQRSKEFVGHARTRLRIETEVY